MKRQNGVTLSGRLTDLHPGAVGSGPLRGRYVLATLITDHVAYGGHHAVLFPEPHANDVETFWALTGGRLEVTIEGWLRSQPQPNGLPAACVVVDRVIYLTVTEEMRVEAVRRRARDHGAT
jgi:hypothetical protein